MQQFFLCCAVLTALGVAADSSPRTCTPVMCISLSVDAANTTFTYELEALQEVGWMAIGFGPSMWFSPMVIVWPNPDGVTLSQRKASGFVMPTPDPHPERVATLTPNFPSFDQIDFPKVSFSLPATNQTDHVLVWAFSKDRPSSSDPNADISKHSYADVIRLSTSTTGAHHHLEEEDLVSTKILLFGHAVFASFGFLVLLPTGSLVARWGRTVTVKWIEYHRAFNMVVALPIISFGLALAVTVVHQHEEGHFSDLHAITGLLLYCLYIGQILLGWHIHAHRVLEGARFHPPRNIVHVFVGIGMVALAIYQVRTGFTAWHSVTGTSVPSWVRSAWFGWSLVVLVAYFAGLVFLRRQFKQERSSIITALARDEERGPMMSCENNDISKEKFTLYSESEDVLLSPVSSSIPESPQTAAADRDA